MPALLPASSQPHIVGSREGHHPTDVDRGVRAEQKSGGVHQEKIRVLEAGGLDRAVDAGEGWIISVRSGDASQNVGSLQSRRKLIAVEIERDPIQKVRDVGRGDSKLAETVEQIGPTHTPRARSSGDVVLGLSPDSDRIANLGVQTGWGDGYAFGVCCAG